MRARKRQGLDMGSHYLSYKCGWRTSRYSAAKSEAYRPKVDQFSCLCTPGCGCSVCIAPRGAGLLPVRLGVQSYDEAMQRIRSPCRPLATRPRTPCCARLAMLARPRSGASAWHSITQAVCTAKSHESALTLPTMRAACRAAHGGHGSRSPGTNDRQGWRAAGSQEE